MKKLLSLLLVLSLCLMGVSAFAEIEYAEGLSQAEIDALETTTVIKSDDSPTGYYVTFRYKDPEASRVRVNGEWKFSDKASASFVSGLNALPEDWQNGYDVYQTNGWPTYELEKNGENGIWAVSIPLPNGTWRYSFYIDGAQDVPTDDLTDAVQVADPANIIYVADPDAEHSGEELQASVYVPYDEVKQSRTPARIEEAPRDGEKGQVIFEKAQLDNGEQVSYGLYLPYAFDANREEAYPILVLFHGGGGYEGSWFNNGLANIMDNMIAEGRLEPTIVVTPDGSDFAAKGQFPPLWDNGAELDLVVNRILPHMVETYNATEDAAYRAIAGLSMGGTTIGYAMSYYPDVFDTYLLFSPALFVNVYPDYDPDKLQGKNVFLGYGDYDRVLSNSLYQFDAEGTGELQPMWGTTGNCLEYLYQLSKIGVEVKTYNLPYGHEWVLWRQLLVHAIDTSLWK